MDDQTQNGLVDDFLTMDDVDRDDGKRTLAGPTDLGICGFRLDELQIQNFGTYDGQPSVIQFGRGGAIFTGRNGVGKTTAIDAFRMLIAQEPSFNDATVPEARKRDRDIRTYYQGVLGKVQRDGQNEYRVLRPYEERKLMAIVGIFADSHGRVISAARLVQYDPQGQGNSQRYIIARSRLDIARDFPSFETSRAIRVALADKNVRVYDTFNAYRTALSGFYGIADPKQAWALFERAIGTKTVDNLTEFMRDLILPVSALTDTADQLVLSTVALDDAYQTVKLDEAKILRLQRIVREIDDLERSFQTSGELRRLQAFRRTAAIAVTARATRNYLNKLREDFASTSREHATALSRRDELARRVSELELQERALGGQLVTEWRREIETRSNSIVMIKADLAKLSTTLSVFGLRDGISFEESHHTEAQWQRIADESLGEFQTVDIAQLEREIHEREAWIVEATSKSPDYIAIAEALGKARTTSAEAATAADSIGKALAVEDHKIKAQQTTLETLTVELGQKSVPLSAWRGYRRIAHKIDQRASIFTGSPETINLLGDGIWERVRSRLDEELIQEGKRRETTIGTLMRLAPEYLKDFTSEGAHLQATGLAAEDASSAREDWRQRRINIESRELIRHRERLQQAMTDAIDNGIVNIKTQLEKEKLEIRDTIAGINDTLRAVIYDPTHGTRIRFVAHDSASQRIGTFSRDLRQVTDDWIGSRDSSIEDRYLKTKRFIDQVKDVPENAAWRRDVLDSRRWFTFVAQEYKFHTDGSEDIINDYDGASGSSGGQKERLAMTVMAAGLAWRFGMVNQVTASKSFRILMLDEAFKNSHDDTTRALLELFKAFGFQMIFAMPSKNLAVVANHIDRAFAVDTQNRRTILTVHTLKDLVYRNQNAAAAIALQMAKEAGINIAELDLSQIDERLAGLTTEAVIRMATDAGAKLEAAE